jgi:hypothetical protein
MITENRLFNEKLISIQKDYIKVVNCIVSCETRIQEQNAEKLKEFFKRKHINNPFYSQFKF